MLDPGLWLHIAKSVPVGQHRRVKLPGDSTAACRVSNQVDRWTAYCHRRKEGGAVKKNGASIKHPAPEQRGANPPRDLAPLTYGLRQQAEVFLAGKGMSLVMFGDDPVRHSAERARLAFGGDSELRPTMGRSLIGADPKWIDYETAPYFIPYHSSWAALSCMPRRFVLVEDVFSAYKVAWAQAGVVACCTHGCDVKDGLLVHLMDIASEVNVLYDGDEAGRDGLLRVIPKLRAVGLTARGGLAPNGMDPKNMSAAAIREHIEGGPWML